MFYRVNGLTIQKANIPFTTKLQENEYIRSVNDDILKTGMYKGLNYSMKGCLNTNYKEMTQDRKLRLFSVVKQTAHETNDTIVIKKLEAAIKNEFKEFKKISLVWVTNNFRSITNLIHEVNLFYGINLKYNFRPRGKNKND